MRKNLVNWGLAASAWGKITVNEHGEDVYEAPTLFEGTRQINFTPDGQQTKVYADGTVIYVGNQNSGYTGTMEVTSLDETFAQYVLGEKKTAKGVVYEEEDAEPMRFYLIWEWKQDQRNSRHIMYNVTINRPDVSASTAGDGGTKNPQYRTLNMTAIPRWDGVVKARTNAETDQETYDGWFTAAYDPKAAVVPGG